jgi:hypothetical protein
MATDFGSRSIATSTAVGSLNALSDVHIETTPFNKHRHNVLLAKALGFDDDVSLCLQRKRHITCTAGSTCLQTLHYAHMFSFV